MKFRQVLTKIKRTLFGRWQKADSAALAQALSTVRIANMSKKSREYKLKAGDKIMWGCWLKAYGKDEKGQDSHLHWTAQIPAGQQPKPGDILTITQVCGDMRLAFHD